MKSYIQIWELLRDNWHYYGGFKAIIFSPYVHIAALFTYLYSNYWSTSINWSDDVLSVIPSILGFSLGAYAIFLAFSNENFVKVLTNQKTKTKNPNDNISIYLVINSQFVHFMLIQVISIFLSITAKAEISSSIYGTKEYLISCLGFWFFCYALLTAVATTFSLLRLARLFNKFTQIKNTQEPKENTKDPS